MNAARPVSFFQNTFGRWPFVGVIRGEEECVPPHSSTTTTDAQKFFLFYSPGIWSQIGRRNGIICVERPTVLFSSPRRRRRPVLRRKDKWTTTPIEWSDKKSRRIGCRHSSKQNKKTLRPLLLLCPCAARKSRSLSMVQSHRGPKSPRQEEEEENVDCFYSAITQSTFELLFFFLFFKCFCPFAFTRVSSAHARVSIR